ncbi:unnamed protein product [Prorocentrum cordatum]|uniref:RRM domain-containing protein n=1 Tax=Prorocentrum cordatum TaxID=2364126 RepID=A0ABN9VMB3_9DINO|nr:unnamed protein product [Polarella glacialis]
MSAPWARASGAAAPPPPKRPRLPGAGRAHDEPAAAAPVADDAAGNVAGSDFDDGLTALDVLIDNLPSRAVGSTTGPLAADATPAAAQQNGGGILEWSKEDIAQLKEDVSEKIKTLGKWKDDDRTRLKLKQVVDKIAKEVEAHPPASASDRMQALRGFVGSVLGARGPQLCDWLVEHLRMPVPPGPAASDPAAPPQPAGPAGPAAAQQEGPAAAEPQLPAAYVGKAAALVIRNLPGDVSEEKVVQFLAPAGRVRSIQFFGKRGASAAATTAFCEFHDLETAGRAEAQLRGAKLEGRDLAVKWPSLEPGAPQPPLRAPGAAGPTAEEPADAPWKRVRRGRKADGDEGGKPGRQEADVAQLKKDAFEKIQALGKWRDDERTRQKLRQVVDRIAREAEAHPGASPSEWIPTVSGLINSVLGARGPQLCSWLEEHLGKCAPPDPPQAAAPQTSPPPAPAPALAQPQQAPPPPPGPPKQPLASSEAALPPPPPPGQQGSAGGAAAAAPAEGSTQAEPPLRAPYAGKAAALFIKNLPGDVDEEKLLQLLGPAGAAKSVKFFGKNGVNKANAAVTAFCEFNDLETTGRAEAQLKGAQLEGRSLTVKWPDLERGAAPPPLRAAAGAGEPTSGQQPPTEAAAAEAAPAPETWEAWDSWDTEPPAPSREPDAGASAAPPGAAAAPPPPAAASPTGAAATQPAAPQAPVSMHPPARPPAGTRPPLQPPATRPPVQPPPTEVASPPRPGKLLTPQRPPAAAPPQPQPSPSQAAGWNGWSSWDKSSAAESQPASDGEAAAATAPTGAQSDWSGSWGAESQPASGRTSSTAAAQKDWKGWSDWKGWGARSQGEQSGSQKSGGAAKGSAGGKQWRDWGQAGAGGAAKGSAGGKQWRDWGQAGAGGAAWDKQWENWAEPEANQTQPPESQAAAPGGGAEAQRSDPTASDGAAAQEAAAWKPTAGQEGDSAGAGPPAFADPVLGIATQMLEIDSILERAGCVAPAGATQPWSAAQPAPAASFVVTRPKMPSPAVAAPAVESEGWASQGSGREAPAAWQGDTGAPGRASAGPPADFEGAVPYYPFNKGKKGGKGGGAAGAGAWQSWRGDGGGSPGGQAQGQAPSAADGETDSMSGWGVVT